MKRYFSIIAILAIFSVQSVVAQSFKQQLAIDVPASYDNQDAQVSPLRAALSKRAAAQELLDKKFIVTLDEDWSYKLFEKSDFSYLIADFEPKGWSKVTVPATIDASPSSNICVLHNSIYISQHWGFREMFVELPHIGATYSLFINGSKVGSNLDTHNSATFNVTKFVEEGYNSLILVLDLASNSSMLESNKKPLATIFGDVVLYSTPKLRIRDYSLETYLAEDGNRGNVQLSVEIKTHLLNTKDARVQYELYSADSVLLSKDDKWTKLEMRDSYIVDFHTLIDNIEQYSTLNPYQYYAVVTLIQENRITQSVKIDIPILKKSSNSNKFYINGIETPLIGVVWERSGAFGYLSGVRKSLEALKARGFNAVMLTKPEQEQFYSECDELGLWVVDMVNIDLTAGGKSRGISGSLANNPNSASQIIERIVRQYHSTKNHPSVLATVGALSLSNGYSLYEGYMALRKLSSDVVFASNATDFEWNNDFMVWNEPSSKDIKSFDSSRPNLVVYGGKSFEQLYQLLGKNGFAAAFTTLEAAMKSPLVDNLTVSASSNGFVVEVENPILSTELINVGYEVVVEDRGIVLQGAVNDTKSSAKSITGNVDINYIKSFLIKQEIKNKRFTVVVKAMSGSAVLGTSQFEYKITN